MNLVRNLRKSRLGSIALVAMLIPSVSLFTLPVSANPNGATVITGDINITGIGTSNLTINQSSRAAIINWQNFSIAAGERTHFQQVAGGIALNRVTGGNPTAIYGSLTATGTVLVINPNGIMVGPSGVIDVGGALTLSTLDIANQDFLNGGIDRFSGGSTTGVANYGSIRAANGDVMFLGGFAHNHGSIEASRGTAALAAGGEMIVGQAGDSVISIRSGSSYNGIGVSNTNSIRGAATELQSHGNAFALAINNGGLNRATGGSRDANGRATLRATGSSNRVVNSGTIVARSAAGNGGNVQVEAGTFENSGTIDVSGTGANGAGTVDVIAESLLFSDSSRILANSIGNGGGVNLDATTANIGGLVDASSRMQRGGDVTITGDTVDVNAGVDVSGAYGGSAKIGGDFQGGSANGLRASSSTIIGSDASFDATASIGDAGQVVVWSDGDTIFEGDARANAIGAIGNGGLIEISGKRNLTFRGSVSANSQGGRAGTVLFDPGTLTIGNGLTGINQLSNQTINDLLQGGTSVLLTTDNSDGSDGNIIFSNTGVDNDRHDAIQWTNSDASFGAFAAGNILVETHIRTSGAGSINLLAGWTGLETDTELGAFAGVINGTADVQSIFNTYVAAGQFGDSGNLIVGGAALGRHVEVGSRYGNTNVAAESVLVSASDTNGESRHAQIGFRDAGQIFAPRIGTLDLNNRVLEADNNPLVGIAGQNERADGMGVFAINSEGVHDGTGGLTSGTDATFIPYANHYMNARQGNWWWQQIDRNEGSDPQGLGGNRPEMGAGQSLTNRADINVFAKANVVVQGGGRSQSAAQIGHGGDSAGWADHRAITNSGIENGQTQRYWSQNGATNDRSGMSIGRLRPVYGNINVLAGIDGGVTVDASGNVTAAITAGAGSVIVSGLQRLGSSNNPTNDEQNDAGGGAPALIGHGGVGQFGEFNGDIQVRAGSGIIVRAGSNSRGYAQIGHNVDTYHYWDPPSNADHQIRFFASQQDFNDPLLRRGELFSGSTNIAQGAAGDTFTGTRSTTRILSDPGVAGAVTVEALDGSVVTGFHGDVTVQALSGDVIVQGYNTEDQSETGSGAAGDLGLTTNRDRRYAKIGHGGTSAAVWREESGYTGPAGGNRDFELVAYRIPTNDGETGSGSVIGETGQQLNRALTFMTITGDVAVTAGGDISVKAGNDTFDFAQIGHGGNELADWETSSFIAGNIDLVAGGALDVMGGGEVKWTGTGNNNTNSRHMRSQAQVGHGGYQAGFLAYFGDITVNTGDDITITGGAYGDNSAKIGHKGNDSFGMVGGDFNRSENFFFDGVSTDIASSVSGTTGTVTYSGDTANVSGFTTRTFDLTTNTANISVNSTGGSVILDHLNSQTRANGNQIATGSGGLARSNSAGQMEDAFSQIGHGGNNWGGEYWRNSRTNYDDMVGDVSVTAATDLLLKGGDRSGMWSRVGHGFTGDNVRVRNGEEMLIAGAVTVNVGNDVILDGTAGAEMDINEDQPAKDNGLAIGHGAMAFDDGGSQGQLAVLDGGAVNGISLASPITVNAGRDITVQGGNGAQDVAGELGTSGTHSQIGHGAASLFGDNLSDKGYNGDINVNAVRDILLRATENGIVNNANGDIVYSSQGGAAVIGNGGIHMDAPASGDINVFAGNDLNMIAPPRLSEDINLQGTQGDGGFTHLNFTKIGHFSTENQDSGVVNVGLLTGDISVVAGGNMTMTAGQTPDHSSGNFLDFGLVFAGDHLIDPDGDGTFEVDDTYVGQIGRQGVTGGFSQVGHGGPGVGGNLTGDIEVLVAGNLTTNDGTVDNSGQVTPFSGNNYNKIGHGDWMNGGTVGFRGAATGVMSGDIVVAVGESADLENTMIGHIDSTVSGGISGNGTTRVAVSRNYPFYTGTGTLTATGITEQADAVGDDLLGTGVVSGTVFTSGSAGADILSIYMPERDNNLLEIGTTRLNSDSVFYDGTLGARPTGTPGGIDDPHAGDADEVFLAPDLWWQSAADAQTLTDTGYTSGVFPTAAGGSQGGTVSTVDTVGGLPNLTLLTTGALGSSPNGSANRSHNLSGGLYTLFYDALEPVTNGFPPGIPDPAPNIGPFVFTELFDSFERVDDGLDGYLGGTGFEGDLPYLEGYNDEFGVPGWFFEEVLDSMFGPRTSGGSVAGGPGALQAAETYGDDTAIRGVSSDVQGEDDEELERRNNRENRPVGKVQSIYYLYSPGSVNPYSSFSLFGTPQ